MKLRTVLLAAVWGVSTSLVLLPMPDALAQGSGEQAGVKRVAVGTLAGAKPQSAREWLIEGFEDDPSTTVVGKDEASALKTGATESEIAAMAAEVQADAVILGSSALKPRVGWVAQIQVHNGEDGALIEEFEVKGGVWNNYRKAMRDVSQFLGAVAQARLAPEPEPEVDLEEDEVDEEEPQESQEAPASNDDARPSPLYARVGVRLYSRSFRYTDPLASAPELLTYNLAAAPMVFGRLDWYPLAHGQGGFPANVGISGGYELGVATDVRFGDDTLKQAHSIWYVGPKFRLPISQHEFSLFGSFGSHRFEIQGNNRENVAFPDVNYRFVDVGLEARFLFDQVRLGGHAKHRFLLAEGEISTAAWFPNARGRGLSLGGEVGWKLMDALELLVGVDVLQYGLDFNPVDRSSDRIAGGATDRYVSVWGALGFTWPGDDPGGSVSASSSSSSSSDDDEDFDDFDDFD